MKMYGKITEEELLTTLNKILKYMCYKWRFGYLTIEDIKQEAFVLLTEKIDGRPSVLDKYDGKQPLENFLRVCLKNKLHNYKRNKYQRIYQVKCQCKLCKKQVDHEQRLNCKHYKQWYLRNLSKKNVLMPITIDKVDAENERNMEVADNIIEDLNKKEIFKKINFELPLSMRPDYIKMMNGTKLGKIREEEILTKIREILNVRQNKPRN